MNNKYPNIGGYASTNDHSIKKIITILSDNWYGTYTLWMKI